MKTGQVLQGRALVASPYLSDPNFLRSVIYILRHDGDGAIGLVLNRPTDRTVGSLFADPGKESEQTNAVVYCGGPVEGPLIMLQDVNLQAINLQEANGQDVNPRMVTGLDRILEIAKTGDAATYRIFESYAGWEAGQLEDELNGGGWLVWDIETAVIFADSEELWQLALKSIGRGILAAGIDPSRIPDNPAYN